MVPLTRLLDLGTIYYTSVPEVTSPVLLSGGDVGFVTYGDTGDAFLLFRTTTATPH